MAFSGHYLCSSSPNIDSAIQIPLYTEKEDILPYCDHVIKIAEDDNLGILYASAMDPDISDNNRRRLEITRQNCSLVHKINKGIKNTVLCTADIDGGEYGTILNTLSFTVSGHSKYIFSPGEKNQTTIGIVMDYKDGDEIAPIYNLGAYINKNWINCPYSLSRKIEQIMVPVGKHTISFVVSTKNENQEGNAYFEIADYSFCCIPQKCIQTPSGIHITEANSKEYILC